MIAIRAPLRAATNGTTSLSPYLALSARRTSGSSITDGGRTVVVSLSDRTVLATVAVAHWVNNTNPAT